MFEREDLYMPSDVNILTDRQAPAAIQEAIVSYNRVLADDDTPRDHEDCTPMHRSALPDFHPVDFSIKE
ncbi:hypothetical protein [Rhodococcoides fascians]|uniref:hypothetical protein n=1 Tax=Rhodococcoides fascians TaxID=1828 RepID=UPI001E3892D4|nr:hypothetical protein [Rhodococcus fascians]